MTLSPTARFILESLSIEEKTCEEISFELGIPNKLVFFAIEQLKLMNIVELNQNRYKININQKSKIIEMLNSKKSKKFEVKSILDAAKEKNESDAEALNISKVFLTKEELEITKGLLNQLNSFLNDKRSKKSNIKGKAKHIFYWGRQSYQDVVSYLYN